MLHLGKADSKTCINTEPVSSKYRGDLKSGNVWTGLFEGQISKCQALAIAIVPNHLKTRPLKIWTFLDEFQMIFDQMAAICSNFR